MTAPEADLAVVRQMRQIGTAYGRALGVMHAAAQAFNEALGAGFRNALPDDPEAVERRAHARYLERLRRERRIGLQHVRTEAVRVRRELGLTP